MIPLVLDGSCYEFGKRPSFAVRNSDSNGVVPNRLTDELFLKNITEIYRAMFVGGDTLVDTHEGLSDLEARESRVYSSMNYKFTLGVLCFNLKSQGGASYTCFIIQQVR